MKCSRALRANTNFESALTCSSAYTSTARGYLIGRGRGWLQWAIGGIQAVTNAGTSKVVPSGRIFANGQRMQRTLTNLASSSTASPISLQSSQMSDILPSEASLASGAMFFHTRSAASGHVLLSHKDQNDIVVIGKTTRSRRYCLLDSQVARLHRRGVRLAGSLYTQFCSFFRLAKKIASILDQMNATDDLAMVVTWVNAPQLAT